MNRTGVLRAGAGWLLVAAIPASVLLRAAGIPPGWADALVGLAALAVVLLTVAAVPTWFERAAALGLLVAYFVQATLSAIASPLGNALTEVSKLVLFAAAVWYARRATGRVSSTRSQLSNLT